MERCREKNQDLHMVFVDLEKTYDKFPRKILWRVLENIGVRSTYNNKSNDTKVFFSLCIVDFMADIYRNC